MKHLLLSLVLCAMVAVGCSGSHDPGAATGGDKPTSQGTGVGNGQAPPDSGSASVADLGVPLYPGSTSNDAGGGDIKKVSGTHNTVTSSRASDDSADKILAFYKEKLPTFEASKTGESDILTGKGTDGGEVAISVTKDGDHSKITIVHNLSK